MQSEKTKSFIKKARSAHGDRFDYSNVVYCRSDDKVIITCKVHGNFKQQARYHLKGHGCRKCSGTHSYSSHEWIQKAIEVNGELYEYDKTIYVSSREKVVITCKEHGDFEQIPSSHLYGHGCAKCAGMHSYSTNEWTELAIAVHGGRYDYSKVIYYGAADKVIITCIKHGEFNQEPYNHLRGHGCPSCPKRYGDPTSIYLLTNGKQVKIGISLDVDRRLPQLGAEQPFASELVYTWVVDNFPTARKIERSVHLKLKERNAGLSGFAGSTEWFNVTPIEAAAYISEAVRGKKRY